MALQNLGFSSLLPVQIAVWQETIGPGAFERDLCINSPTGSGKTLAYALPIVQRLSTRAVKCLRALIVLPTRDLAVQVRTPSDLYVFFIIFYSSSCSWWYSGIFFPILLWLNDFLLFVVSEMNYHLIWWYWSSIPVHKVIAAFSTPPCIIAQLWFCSSIQLFPCRVLHHFKIFYLR